MTQRQQFEVRIHASQEEMAAAAARAVVDCLLPLLAAGGGVRVILASASSQIKFLEALASLGGVDWSRVTLFHMDEYLGLSPEHPASFRRFLRDGVEARLKPGKFHYLEGDCAEPLDECDRYAALLRESPIDLCCLGIGENGHIAFNDPPVADFADPRWVKIVKLDEASRVQQVGEGHFPMLEVVPTYALSLTIPALCSARRMLCIVPERRKAQAVKAALHGPISTACPASILRQQAHCTLFLDADSASLL